MSARPLQENQRNMRRRGKYSCVSNQGNLVSGCEKGILRDMRQLGLEKEDAEDGKATGDNI